MNSSVNSHLSDRQPLLKKRDSFIEDLLRKNIRILTESEMAMVTNPWDLICRDGSKNKVVNAFKTFKTLGLGDTYIKGLWHCERLDILFKRLFELDEKTQSNPIMFELPNSVPLVVEQLMYKTFNISLIRQNDVAKQHYDLPVELYEGFLGPSMKYTTGDWTDLEKTPENLTVAQEQNLEYWVKELNIKDGDIVLDCGCGWGTLPQYLQKRFDLTYIGITISDVQVDYCRAQFKQKDRYHFFNHSYHNAYTEILSRAGVNHITQCIFLETMEHGGTRNWPYMLKNVRVVMPQHGLLGIQVIGADHPNFVADPYLNRYIFPHGCLGSPSELGKALESDRQFVKLKEQNIAQNYPATLRAWHYFFQKNWSHIQPHIAKIIESTPFLTTEEWKRHWEFYLMLCTGAFEAGTFPQVYQLTARPNFFVN